MANTLFNQIMGNNQNNVIGLINTIKGASNPQQALLNLATKNSSVANVLNEVKACGGDAKALFYSKANKMGIDPNTILNQLK